MGTKAVFLDRDGVIIRNREDYVKTVDEVEVLEGAPEAVGLLSKLGFRVVIVTNQSMLNRGLSTVENLNQIHRRVRDTLSKSGGSIDAIYYCPHRPEEKCDCRKPKIGLFERAVRELNIDVGRSWLIGDKESDIQAGRSIGCMVIEIPTNAKRGLEEAVARIAKWEGRESEHPRSQAR